MIESIEQQGFAIITAAFAPRELDEIISKLDAALGSALNQLSVRTKNDAVYAARNVDEWFPCACDLWRKECLIEPLRFVLGEEFGLVRMLYFDKPPSKPWALPWHKDMTIAVTDNGLPSDAFQNPTTKSGVPHVQAPEGVLQRMMTLRLHLDDVDETNGPLSVIEGSHCNDKERGEDGAITKILVNRGDVLAMRPLLSHSSSLPTASAKPRRVLHFEFAADRELTDGYEWRQFHSLAGSSSS